MTISVYIPTNSARRFPYLWRLSSEELMLLSCGVGEDSWESLGLQGDPTSQSQRKSILNIHWKDWCWSWSYNTLATWCKELTHWKGPWCWERLRAEGTTEDEMVGWHHWLDGHEFEQAPGVGDGQGSLVSCSPWSGKDTTEWLTWTEILCTLQIHIKVSISGYRWRNWDSDR